MRKLLLVTDAWEPQTNGVVTTLQQVTRHLPEFGFEPFVVHPGEFETLPLPSYPEIRIAVEKNVQAFLGLDIDADKVTVGDGPQRAELQARYPDAHWLGYRKGQPLIEQYAAADAFVFPSRTDTFGLVMLEALACGTPVAAYPVTGPKDVVRQGVTGWLDEDLDLAVRRAQGVRREDCRAYAVANGWPKIARTLADNLALVDWRHC